MSKRNDRAWHVYKGMVVARIREESGYHGGWRFYLISEEGVEHKRPSLERLPQQGTARTHREIDKVRDCPSRAYSVARTLPQCDALARLGIGEGDFRHA